jgi:5-methylcytosine-specific restriction protein A
VVSTVADHWPVDRRELVARGMNPDDPSGGRGLCASCHGKETAIHQPGGWANR